MQFLILHHRNANRLPRARKARFQIPITIIIVFKTIVIPIARPLHPILFILGFGIWIWVAGSEAAFSTVGEREHAEADEVVAEYYGEDEDDEDEDAVEGGTAEDVGGCEGEVWEGGDVGVGFRGFGGGEDVRTGC